jgi:hypothetical protein
MLQQRNIMLLHNSLPSQAIGRRTLKESKYIQYYKYLSARQRLHSTHYTITVEQIATGCLYMCLNWHLQTDPGAGPIPQHCQQKNPIEVPKQKSFVAEVPSKSSYLAHNLPAEVP